MHHHVSGFDLREPTRSVEPRDALAQELFIKELSFLQHEIPPHCGIRIVMIADEIDTPHAICRSASYGHPAAGIELHRVIQHTLPLRFAPLRQQLPAEFLRRRIMGARPYSHRHVCVVPAHLHRARHLRIEIAPDACDSSPKGSDDIAAYPD